jgi:Restriction endonuclease fold toxin 7
VTDVDPDLFYDTAAVYRENSDKAAAALHKLAGVDASNGAGTHGVGPEWAKGYDSAADEAGEVGFRLVNVFHNLGGLLQQDGVNHDETEQASTLNQRDPYGAPITPPGETPGTFIDAAVHVPSAGGGGDPEPRYWDLVGGRIVDGWPDGHPDRLLAASSAWETFGHELVGIDDMPSAEEQRLHVDVEAAEIAFVFDRLNDARDVSTNIAGASGDLSRASKDYGDKLKSVKDDMAYIVDKLHWVLLILDAYPPQLHRLVEPVKEGFINLAASQINGLNAGLRATATTTMKDLTSAGTAMATTLPATKALLALVPRNVNPTPAQQVNDNRIKGRRAEEIAKIDQSKKTSIQVTDPNTGAQRTRIPDEIDADNHVVREVKNVKKLDLTQQIRDFAQYAQQRGFKLVIVVDKGRTDYSGFLDNIHSAFPGLEVQIDDSKNLS